MAMSRLLHEDVMEPAVMHSDVMTAPIESVQRTATFSADQAFHAKEWARRESVLQNLVAERTQRRNLLSATADASVSSRIIEQLAVIESEMSAVFDESFHLGIMHAVIYLQRSAFQIAPDLLGKLIFTALPELKNITTHIMEVKEGYWLLVHLLFTRAIAAWRALCCSLQLDVEELRASSRTFALWDFVMTDLVEPSVMLADACRGRSISAQLTPEAAWPLVMVALKKGLRLLLLSGRHHLYALCFGREIRQLLLQSAEQLAWWANNLWVTVGGSKFFNDETVERFLIKVLKRDMEGGHFTDREAARSAATVEALQMVREELRAMIGGVRRDKADQATAEARRLQQQPGVAAALLVAFNEAVLPSIKLELAARLQLDIMAATECYDAPISMLSEVIARADVVADELMYLSAVTGTSARAGLEALLSAPLRNAFTGEEMQHTDVAALGREADDRVLRHVCGDYLNADKGFSHGGPRVMTKKEPPIVIGPVPRKVVRQGRKLLAQTQRAKWALGQAGVVLGPWDVALPHSHVLFQQQVWLPALPTAKAKAWPALVEVLGLKPWGFGDGGLLGMDALAGRGVRRNVLVCQDGTREIECAAFGVDAFGDVRAFQTLDDVPTARIAASTAAASAPTGLDCIRQALRSRLTPLFRAGFQRGYYPFDAGDLNPYKWVTFYTRSMDRVAALPQEDQARLERAGGKIHECAFPLDLPSPSLKDALLDKLFGGREAGLRAIGEAIYSPKLSLKSIVPPGCELTLHGVGASPLQPLTVRVHDRPSATAETAAATRHADDRRPAEPRVEIRRGEPSPNAEGEDQLWRHACEEVSMGCNFLAYVADTDYKEAALVLLPRLMFPEHGAPSHPLGLVFVAPVNRGAPQTQPYWCMNEFVDSVAMLPDLVIALPGDTPAARRLRCAHMAAVLVLLGGDTTPAIQGLADQGIQLAVSWAWYTDWLVEASTHVASGLEIFRLKEDAVIRLHKILYLFRARPNIQKLLKFDDQRQHDAQRAWLDALTIEMLATAVLNKVTAPVGVPGQPVRSLANIKVIITVANARLLQWGLSPLPDQALFHARDGLKALEGHQFGPWTTMIDWDMSEAKPRRGAARGGRGAGGRGGGRGRGRAAPPPPPPPTKLTADDIFAKYQNDLSGVDSLSSQPKGGERRAFLVGQLEARRDGGEDVCKKKGWKQLKSLLRDALAVEDRSPGAGGAAAPSGSAPPSSAAEPMEVEGEVEVEGEEAADVEMEEEAASEDEDDGDADEVPSSDEEEAQPQPFFCCTKHKKSGGIWYCQHGCGHCFHNACNAHSPEHNDGANKMCVPCYARLHERGRGARRRSRV